MATHLTHDQILSAILAARPCHGEAWARASAAHWPADPPGGLLRWLATTPERDERVVSVADRVWTLCAVLAEYDRPALLRGLRVIALRAVRVHAPAALDRVAGKLGAAGIAHTLRDHAATLRALPDNVPAAGTAYAAWAAAWAAYAAAARAADDAAAYAYAANAARRQEREQQIADLLAAHEET